VNFCSHCAAPVAHRVPPGDHLPRFVCDQCGTIHYQNPKLVVGCVPEDGGRILLCRRAIEPRRGYWTVPAGFMENDETLQQAAERESHEEALAHVEIGSLLTIVHVMHAHQVHVFFRARLAVPEFGVGPESLDSKMVTEGEVPWDDLAFPSITFTLRRYFEDRSARVERQHFATFDYRTR
jgi:ADP-ribose pyrophosphatase YjhB (NUDIX family)